MLRNKTKRGLALSAMVALGLAAAMPARAAIVNGGFEGFPDFTGYTTIGNTSIQASNYKPPVEGKQQALLSNSTNPVPGATGATTNIGALEAFVNLGAGALGAGAKSGSAVKQTFTAVAGDKVSFSTDFLTNEGRNADLAFYTLQLGASTATETVLATAGVTPTVATSIADDVSSDFNKETGYTTTTITLAAGGTYTLAFGVLNIGDTNVTSGLLIDNLVQAAGPGGGGGGGVPLPAGAYLMTLGLATAGLFSAKLRRTTAC